MSPEALVSDFRDAREAGDLDRAEECLLALLGEPDEDGRVVGGSCERAIRAMAKKYKINGLGEFRARCYTRILASLQSPREKKPLWEANFRVALFGIVVEERRRWMREREAAKQLTSLDDVAPLPDGNAEDPLVSIDAQRAVQILLTLDAPLRRAAFLRWLHLFKVESDDAEEITIATMLGVSGRTVRSYLAKARAQVISRLGQGELVSDRRGSA